MIPDVLQLIDWEIEELRSALLYYWKKRDRRECRDCYHELLGVRRVRSMIVSAADRAERRPRAA